MRNRLFGAVVCALAIVACSSDDDSATDTTRSESVATEVEVTPTEPAEDDSSSTTDGGTSPTETPPPTDDPAPTTILLTNDDGIGSDGIDAVAQSLQQIPNVEVVIVAPAENQSGKSDTTSPTPPTAAAATTISGIEGTAVAGTPADAIIYALDTMGVEPDLVVSGSNAGQNIGTFVPLSGTVGAARTAARRDIPAVAVSSGFADAPDYATAASVVTAEVEALLAAGLAPNTDQTVINLNVPTCPAGTQFRGVVDVPVATSFPEGIDGINLVFDCASAATDPADDLAALLTGFASRSIVPADL